MGGREWGKRGGARGQEAREKSRSKRERRGLIAPFYGARPTWLLPGAYLAAARNCGGQSLDRIPTKGIGNGGGTVCVCVGGGGLWKKGGSRSEERRVGEECKA